MNKRKIIITVAAVAAVFTAFAISYYFYFQHGLSYDGEFTGAVKMPVTMSRDGNGVPEIRAKTQEDVYYALGYLHAQDRYNLMEYYRSAALGKIARLIGNNGRVLDKLSRTIGFARKAAHIKKSLGEPYLSYLKSYVRGVNSARPLTIGINVLKEEWVETDVIAILVMKEWANSFLNNREILFALPKSVKSKELEEVFPGGMVQYYDDRESGSIQMIEYIASLVKTFIGTYGRGMAFSVPAKVSQSNEYLTGFTLDGDMSFYPGWYPATVVLDDTTIRGITYVGMPFIFSGATKEFSFCGFNLDIDTQDFCIEQVRKLKDVVQYLGRAGWVPYDALSDLVITSDNREQLAVVWSTENGPVLNDILTDKTYKTEVVALKSYFPGSSYLQSLFTIPFAGSAEDASAALQNVESLPKVYMFSANDYIITAYSGKVPIRNAGEDVFVQGVQSAWTGLYDLSGIRDKTFFPAVIYSSDSEGLPPEVRGFCIGYQSRMLRLKQLVEEKSNFGMRDIEEILCDTRSVHAEKFIPVFIDMLKNNPVTSSRLARVYFHDWDFNMSADGVAPALYETILQNYMYETLADEIPGRIDAIMQHYHLLIPGFYEIMVQGVSPVFDDKRTFSDDEGKENIFDRAFFKSLRFLARKNGPLIDDWKWGALHRGHFSIPFKETSLSEILLYEIKDVQLAGGNSTVMLGASGLDLAPTRVTSLKGIFSGSISKVNMNFSYSTNPLSQFYYGRMKQTLTFDLSFINDEYVTKIRPQKK